MIYILMLIFVIFISTIMHKNKDNKKVVIFLSLVLLVSLSFVAGIRAMELGYDAKQYIPTIFKRLEKYDTFSTFSNGFDFEFLFKVISYFAYKIHPNTISLMFFYSFVTTLFMLLFAYNEKDNLPFNCTLVIYYATLYLYSYNIMRQAIALAIIFYSFSLLRKNKYIKSLLFLIVALLSHDSAFIAVPIFIIKFVTERLDTKAKKTYFLTFTTVFVVALCFMYEDIIYLLNNIGLLPDKFVNYLSTYGDNAIDLNLADTLFKLLCVIISFFVLKMQKLEQDESYCFLIYALLALMMNIIAFKIYPIYRCGNYYFYLCLFYLFPKIKTLFCEEQQKFGNGFMYAIVILFFLWKVILGNAYLIYPYSSDIFKFLH